MLVTYSISTEIQYSKPRLVAIVSGKDEFEFACETSAIGSNTGKISTFSRCNINMMKVENPLVDLK